MAPAKHTLIALVENKPGVLNRISSLFRRRGFNIESIAVGKSELPDISRTTIVVDGTTTSVEQVRKQLDKIIDVVRVVELNDEETVSRELALIKVKATSSTRSEIIQIVAIFRANIVDVGIDTLTVEVTGDDNKIDSLIALLDGFGIRELARTGKIAMSRGAPSAASIEKNGVNKVKRKKSTQTL
ncbi:MAG: acetolactate synthase small subunit [Dehalococcoidales bacterium]|nr:acetolactate synthase small subunit [Dehalococcoidales bacterium]